jgi:hypothetical protein
MGARRKFVVRLSMCMALLDASHAPCLHAPYPCMECCPCHLLHLQVYLDSRDLDSHDPFNIAHAAEWWIDWVTKKKAAMQQGAPAPVSPK